MERWEYAAHIQDVSVHLVVLQVQDRITIGIEALDAIRIVGGSSIYPFAQNILLAVRRSA